MNFERETHVADERLGGRWLTTVSEPLILRRAVLPFNSAVALVG